MKSAFWGAATCALALGLGGCANTIVATPHSMNIQWTGSAKRVVLMDPDVKLGELEAGGSIDWRADWSDAGRKFITDDVHTALAAHGIDVVESGTISDPHAVQLTKLHDAVGGAILTHVVLPGSIKLPTKSDPLDYTLGPGVKDLHDRYGADYALFVNVRDTYTTTGRVLLMIAMAAAHVGIQGGQQSAVASLVDLNTGNVVWFNWLTDQGGDLRTAKPAQSTVNNLIKGLPL
jgi:hypothetical protein